MEIEFSRQIFEIYTNFMKIRTVGAELFRADRRTNGRTDMTLSTDAPKKLRK